MRLIKLLTLLITCLDPMIVLAQASSPLESINTKEVGNILIVIFVLSIIFEAALTPIFNWRVFLKRFEGKGVKTPVVVISAFAIFWGYNLDIVGQLLHALGQDGSNNIGGKILTALLIAGGSDGVFRIFTKLNIRDPEERKKKAGEARRDSKMIVSNNKSGTPPVVPQL